MKEKFFKVKNIAEVIPCSSSINSQIADPRKRYDCDDKFRAIVDFIFNLIASGEFTPFELGQAFSLAFMKYEEKRPAPYPIKIPVDKILK